MSTYWFRKRRGLLTKDLGSGWVPISWEGWATLVTMFVLMIVIGFVVGMFSSDATLGQGFLFLGASLIVISLGALVSRHKTRP